MHTAILVKPGVVELRETEIPKPSRGEVLIRIKAALTCGTDLKAYRRGHPLIPMPGPFGHEFSGIAAAVGKGVRRFKEGDEIMAVHTAPCRACRYCGKIAYNLCENIMKTKILGAFAEYILVPPHIVQQNMFLKPKDMPFEEAALLEPISCVVHGIESLRFGSDVRALVIGSGPVGLLHLMLLKDRGVQVTVMDKHADKLKTAKRLGAFATLAICFDPEKYNSSRASPVMESMQNLTNGLGFDFVFECTGMPGVWEGSLYYVRRGGTVVLFGGCKFGTTVAFSAERLHYDEITLKGAFHYAPADVRKACGLLSRGTLPVSRLISGHFPLKQTQKAFEKLRNGEGIKYAIIP